MGFTPKNYSKPNDNDLSTNDDNTLNSGVFDWTRGNRKRKRRRTLIFFCGILILVCTSYSLMTSVMLTNKKQQDIVLPFQLIDFKKNNSSNTEIGTTNTNNTGRQLTRKSNNTSARTVFTNSTKKHSAEKQKILALLYPPGLIGGYRNQVMRFVAFVAYGMQNNFTQLLLPSLMWSTLVQIPGNTSENESKDLWLPIPHDMLFDIDYWNQMSDKDYDGTLPLPKLATKISETNDCWEDVDKSSRSSKIEIDNAPFKLLQDGILQRGFITPIKSFAKQVAARTLEINPRKIDLQQNVSHCMNPGVYGGGRGGGRLWWEYITLSDTAKRKQKEEKEKGRILKNRLFPYNIDYKILRALRPREQWRSVASACVHDATTHSNIIAAPYIALHARVELEMMSHNCGQNMEMNLTKIFGMIDNFIDQEKKEHVNIKGIFIAVSRAGMEVKTGFSYKKYKENVDENLRTLNHVVGSNNHMRSGVGLQNGTIPVFECGASALRKHYYDNITDSKMLENMIDYGSTLEAVINFYIATEANVFIGTKGSSYSTDVWTTRYYLGKGRYNYEYTREKGIQPIDNNGLPEPHSTCPRPANNKQRGKRRKQQQMMQMK